jgi:hypothetical protein
MKLSNFKLIAVTDKYNHATVDVETGHLWWKRKECKLIAKPIKETYWRFTDSGRFTPDNDVEYLEAASLAQDDLNS